MSKAYFDDRGAAERAVLYGRTHREQKPSNDSQIVKLLAQVRDRLTDIERERSEIWDTMQEHSKTLNKIEDQSTSTEKTYISLENRLSRSELQEAPIIERLDNIERAQQENNTEKADEVRQEILGRIEESDIQTARLIERIDESMAMQTRMTRRIDKIVQDKQRLNRKLTRLEENMETVSKALASKALLLLGDKDVVTKVSDVPRLPSFPSVLKDDDDDDLIQLDERDQEALKERNKVDDFKTTTPPPASIRSNSTFMKQAAVTTAFVMVAAVGGWFISHNINPAPENYAAATYEQAQTSSAPLSRTETETTPDFAALTGMRNVESQETQPFYMESNFAEQSEETIATALNDLEPSAPEEEESAAAAEQTPQKLSDIKNTSEISAPQDQTEIEGRPAIFSADENLPASFKELEMQAFKGNAEAQHDLAAMYTAGHAGIEKNYERAAYWFTKASDQGIANARYNLGVLYHQGMGVEQDLNIAINWYQKAAQLGHPEAQYNLGIAHIEGIGVDYNPTKAAEYFESAAASGIPESAFNLGLIYENGLMGEAQPDEALLWYKTASDLGSQDARNAMEQLAKTLNIKPSDVDHLVDDIKDPAHKDKQSNLSLTQKTTPQSNRQSANDSAGSIIAQIQEQLVGFGLYPGPANGTFGPLTSDAIRLYQARNNIPVTGDATEELLVHMLTKNLRNNSYPELGSTE